MTLTPHWQKIQQSNPDVHTALKWVAAEMYKQTRDFICIPQVEEVALNPALELGFLISDDGKIAFSELEVLYDYLVRHVVDLALSTWDNVSNFNKLFDEISNRSVFLDSRHELGASVMLLLVYEYGKDIVSRVAEVATQARVRRVEKGSFRSLYHSFCEVLPKLKVESDLLADAIESILQAIADNYVDGLIYSAVEKLAAQSQETADALYSIFVKRPESLVAGLVANTLLALAKFDLKEAHQRALVLIDCEQFILRRVGIAALGNFKYEGNESYDLLCSTLECLSTLRSIPNVDTDCILIQAYSNLVTQAEEAAEALVEIAARHDSATQNSIASILSIKAKIAHDQPWYKKALLSSARIPSPSEEKLRCLDLCTERYVKNDPEFALKVIEAVAIGWNFREDSKLPEILQGTFVEMYNNQRDVLEAAITRWFASNDRHLHFTARDVFDYFNSSVLDKEQVKSPVLGLSRNVLHTLNEQTVIYVIYRIAGYITDPSTLAASLLSVLRSQPYSPYIVNLITEFLSDYLLYNYPHTTGKYLNHIKAGGATELELSVIQAALDHSNAYFEARQNLPRLKELQPPSQRVYLLQLAQWKQQAAMMEAAKQRSVLRSLFVNVPLKYGHAFFVEREGTFTEPSQLHTISHKLELSQGEFIDPVGQIFNKIQWRLAGLSKAEDEVQDEPTGEADT